MTRCDRKADRVMLEPSVFGRSFFGVNMGTPSHTHSRDRVLDGVLVRGES
jgi:hypothetical protein